MLLNSPIKMKWFYNLYGEKTKLNWFLYEFALEYYDHIMDNPELTDYRRNYNKEQIAQYCTYFTRRLKESVLKAVRGQRKTVIFYQEHIADFYPHFSDIQIKILSTTAMKAYNDLEFCETCPDNCLLDYENRSYNFEIHKEFSS